MPQNLQYSLLTVDIALENEKEALQKAYLESSNLLKGPTGEDDQVPNHEYHLCGVTTKPGVTYIMHSDGSDTNTDEMASPKSRQWWRMEYTSEPRITKQVSYSRRADI